MAAEASFFLALCLLSFSIAGKRDLSFSGALLSSLSLSAHSAPSVHLGPVRSHSLSLSQIECGWLCSGGGANAIDTCAAASCGDGTLGGSEECDDGNTMALDGCDSTCQIEPGYACMHYEPPYYPCGAYSSWCTPVSVSVSVSVAPWRCRYLLYWDSLRSLCPDCCAEGRLPLSSARALTRDIYHAALAGVSTAV